MSVITVLHVSDVHFGCPDPRGEQPHITTELINAVHKHVQGGRRPPDVCVFSGDLTHTGSVEQFTNGEQWLSDLLKPFYNCRLFIIPGNHEVQRPDTRAALDAVKKILRGAMSREDTYFLFRDDITAQPLLNGFYNWHKDAVVRFRPGIVSDWEPSRMACHQKINIDNVQTHLIGLNTAILSCTDKEQGMLVADIKALNEALRDTHYETELIIVISHHPIGIGKNTNEQWLVTWNDEALQSIFLQLTGPHLYLHGHLHEASGTTMSLSTGQSLAFFGAGAAYQSSQYPNKFAFYDIDLAVGRIQPWTYTYRPRGQWGLVEEESQLTMAALPRSFGESPTTTFVAPATRVLPDDYNAYYGDYYLYNWAVIDSAVISEKKLTISPHPTGCPNAELYIHEHVTLTYRGRMRVDRRSLYFDLLGEGHAEEVRLVYHEPIDRRIGVLIGVFAATTLDSDPFCGKIVLSKLRMSHATAQQYLGTRKLIIVDSKLQRHLVEKPMDTGGFINSKIT